MYTLSPKSKVVLVTFFRPFYTNADFPRCIIVNYLNLSLIQFHLSDRENLFRFIFVKEISVSTSFCDEHVARWKQPNRSVEEKKVNFIQKVYKKQVLPLPIDYTLGKSVNRKQWISVPLVDGPETRTLSSDSLQTSLLTNCGALMQLQPYLCSPRSFRKHFNIVRV